MQKYFFIKLNKNMFVTKNIVNSLNSILKREIKKMKKTELQL